MTIHDEIDNYLAADLHNELSDEERSALHAHLVECADCRKLHHETKLMNKVLEENLANEKPDLAFEQRMLGRFRDRVPEKSGGLMKLIVDLMRLRATQLTAVAAVLLALVQVGRLVTGERRTEISDIETETFATGGIVSRMPARALSADEAREVDARTRSNNRVDDLKQKAAVLGGSFHSVAPQTQPESFAPAPMAKRQEPAKTDAPEEIPLETASDSSEDQAGKPEAERVIVTGSNIPAAEAAGLAPDIAIAVERGRKLIRKAEVQLEVVSFQDAVARITALASEEHGYVDQTNSEKQANGKLKGGIIVKVLPQGLERFLQKIRGLGELKNQQLGTEDVSKAYFDTDARLKNARVMEQRLVDMLKTKTGKVADLLAVEKELGRVREEIEKMQGELKFWDSQVQFATVTILLTEKDLEEPAAFLLKERAQLALYTAEVEKIYNDIKSLASPKVQITNAQLNRDNTGRVSANMSLLIAPEESDATVSKVKAMGRVENFQVQTERVAQNGEGMSETAKTKRDKVELNIAISRDEQEQSFQQTSLRIQTGAVDEKTKMLRDLVEKQNGRVRSSTFSRDPSGREFANVGLRVPMKNYDALMQSLGSLGKVENVSVQRQDNTGGRIDEANAPADLSIQVYSQGNIVLPQNGLLATLRRTLAQSSSAIMWSLRMIGVAIAFLAPWIAALVGLVWVVRRIAKARKNKS